MGTEDLTDAARAATVAAAQGGVQVRDLSEYGELNDVVALFSSVWGRDSNPPVTIELLRAFVKAGNFIGGAYRGTELLGASVAFSSPQSPALHSHIAGVSAAARGRNVGLALKLHQRAWALERGFTEIVWTFDPLVSRNAYFNVAKLGARPTEYLTNFYGGMSDSINGHDDTDRLLVRWMLDSPGVIDACAGRFERADAAGALAAGATEVLGVSADGSPDLSHLSSSVALVTVPADIETMRRLDPALASEWRLALRTALDGLMTDGARVTGYDRVGSYILNADGTHTPHDERTTP